MATQSQYQVFLPSSREPLQSVGLPGVSPFSLPAALSPGDTSGSHLNKIAGGCHKRQKNVLAQGRRHRDATTIDMLPDNVLLEIFAVFQMESLHLVWNWHLLVHVCQSWRQIIFASPLRLKLRILCTDGTPVRKNLGIWPRLPMVLIYHYDDTGRGLALDDEDNIIAALEHPDLVFSLGLEVSGVHQARNWERFFTMTQETFPELTYLYLNSTLLRWNLPVLPAEFLGGSTPRLQTIYLWGIPFPALPTLLLSASNLTYLILHDIPPAGFISPGAMVVGLSALPRLKTFIIGFSFTTPRPDRMRPPPLTRTVLPSLTSFEFKGASEYLEDLIGRIDNPQLDKVNITYLNQLVDFQVAQLSKFIDRSVGPKLALFGQAYVYFRNDRVTFDVRCHANHPVWEVTPSTIDIICEGIDWQVSHIAQVLGQISATLATIDHVALIAASGFESRQLESMDDVEWPHLLYQFSTVKTLHVSHGLSGQVALALERITGDMVAEVLPSLDLIYLAGQPASSIEKFLAIHHLSGHPVTAIDTEVVFKERLLSYVREQGGDEYVPECLRKPVIL